MAEGNFQWIKICAVFFLNGLEVVSPRLFPQINNCFNLFTKTSTAFFYIHLTIFLFVLLIYSKLKRLIVLLRTIAMDHDTCLRYSFQKSTTRSQRETKGPRMKLGRYPGVRSTISQGTFTLFTRSNVRTNCRTLYPFPVPKFICLTPEKSRVSNTLKAHS